MSTSTGNRPARNRLVFALLVCGAAIVIQLVTRSLPTVFDPLAAQITDRLFVLRSEIARLTPPIDPHVVHVFIDDRSTRELGVFYIERSQYARVVRNLGKAQVAAQFHDAVFAAPRDPASDNDLIDATREAGNVYYGMAAGVSTGGAPDLSLLPPGGREAIERNRWHPRVTGPVDTIPAAGRHLITFPALAAAARGMSFLDVVPDLDGVFRRVPLLVRDGDGFLPSLSLRVVCDVLGVNPADVTVRAGHAITLPNALRPGASARADIVVPIDAAGRLVVNYPGPWERVKNYSFAAIHAASDDRFALQDLADELRGKVVIVSEFATGTGDVGPVPLDPLYPRSGIHASVLNTILTGRFLRQLSGFEMLFYVELPMLVLLFLAAIRLRTTTFVGATIVMLALYHVAVAGLFMFGGLILDVPVPVISVVAASLMISAYQFHIESEARAVLRSTFNAYFPPSVVDKVIAYGEQLTAAVQKKELTILFSDIVGFTPQSARLDPSRLRDLLNEYFEAMIEIVFRHEGTLDKFIGDGLMAFFGDPRPQPDHAQRCVRAAVEMQLAARRLNEQWSVRGDMRLQIRIGINSGSVVVGNIGSARRVSYTVLGEAVNLAARLESNAPVGGILVSARTYELMNGAVPARRLDPIRVKGVEDPVEVYVLELDAGSREALTAPARGAHE